MNIVIIDYPNEYGRNRICLSLETDFEVVIPSRMIDARLDFSHPYSDTSIRASLGIEWESVQHVATGSIYLQICLDCNTDVDIVEIRQ